MSNVKGFNSAVETVWRETCRWQESVDERVSELSGTSASEVETGERVVVVAQAATLWLPVGCSRESGAAEGNAEADVPFEEAKVYEDIYEDITDTTGKEANTGKETDTEPVEIYEPQEVIIVPVAGNRFLIKGGTAVTVGADNKELQIVPEAQILFEDDKIVCVGDTANPCETTGNETVFELPATYKIYPGLIDSHNHPHYNALPLFEHPGSDYQCAADWRNSDEYGEWKDAYYDPNKTQNKCQLYQLGILRALAGGATTIQGVAVSDKCLRSSKDQPWILRQIDAYNGITEDKVKTNSMGASSLEEEEVAKICADEENGKWDRFIIHLSEGVQGDPCALKEFDTLQNLSDGCLFNSKSVFIHGSAFTQNEFQIIAEAGAQIVWSPSSNTDLYGWKKEASLDVPAALEMGIPVALGPDWYPSHGIGMIVEMQKARSFSDGFFNGTVTAEQIFKMATVGGAKVANLEEHLGRLLPGMKADIAIIAGNTLDPFEPAYLGGVAGVFVGGKLYYGDRPIMTVQNVPDAACEDLSVCKVAKTICLPPTYDGETPTYTSIKESFVLAPDPSEPDESFPEVLFDELPEACGK